MDPYFQMIKAVSESRRIKVKNNRELFGLRDLSAPLETTLSFPSAPFLLPHFPFSVLLAVLFFFLWSWLVDRISEGSCLSKRPLSGLSCGVVIKTWSFPFRILLSPHLSSYSGGHTVRKPGPGYTSFPHIPAPRDQKMIFFFGNFSVGLIKAIISEARVLAFCISSCSQYIHRSTSVPRCNVSWAFGMACEGIIMAILSFSGKEVTAGTSDTSRVIFISTVLETLLIGPACCIACLVPSRPHLLDRNIPECIWVSNTSAVWIQVLKTDHALEAVKKAGKETSPPMENTDYIDS